MDAHAPHLLVVFSALLSTGLRAEVRPFRAALHRSVGQAVAVIQNVPRGGDRADAGPPSSRSGAGRRICAEGGCSACGRERMILFCYATYETAWSPFFITRGPAELVWIAFHLRKTGYWRIVCTVLQHCCARGTTWQVSRLHAPWTLRWRLSEGVQL